MCKGTTTYDPKVPKELKTSQKWFASIITSGLLDNEKIQPISPTGQAIAEEAKHFIAPSPTLKPHQRIEIYNQQYWWRLLTVLQETFPLLTRLFGYDDFNRSIAVPYLLKYPPDHWSLNFLGYRLPQWIEEDYMGSDKKLLLDTAKIEKAYIEGFISKQLPYLKKEDLPTPDNWDELLLRPLSLQPFVYLFEFDYHLFKFRDEMNAQDGNYWIDHDFPPLTREKKYHFLLSRSLANLMVWEEISEAEYFLLQRFKFGSTVEMACEELERRPFGAEAGVQLAGWFQKWVQRRYLTPT